jgi:hypothetical protein
MAKKNAYREFLKQDLGGLIDALALTDLQKHFLRSRWLDQVLWMEGRADSARTWYYVLRLTAIILGVVIPVLVGLNVEAALGVILRYGIVILGLLVAISGALEEFFRYGERWRHYRQTVEWLKIEGWRFFQLSDPYRRYKTHAEAYPILADRIEDLIRQDVNVYVSEIVRSKGEKEEEDKEGEGTKK